MRLFRNLPAFRDTDFYRLYNLKDEKSRGRAMILANVLMCSIGNIFITGTFNTAFLAANGIDIVRVGIIAFVPYICQLLSLLTPRVFANIKRRRWILFATHFIYYGCNVFATTVMPMFVQDPGKRTLWFAVFLFIGNGINSVFGTGVSAWSVKFLPEGRDRNFYFSVSNLVTNVMGTVTAIGAALAADALAGSPRQAQILTTLRLAAFVVLIIGGLLQILVPKEYPYERSTSKVRLRDVVTGEESQVDCDGVFISVGRKPATALFDGQVELDGKGYVQAGENTATNVPGVYAVGDVRTKLLRQIVTAVADGAMAVHMAEEYLGGE